MLVFMSVSVCIFIVLLYAHACVYVSTVIALADYMHTYICILVY